MSPGNNEEQFTVRGEDLDDFLTRIRELKTKLKDAGYRGKTVVAEETAKKVEETAKKDGHWCFKHSTEFFKKGKMKGYAHPIKDANGETTGWCNEEEE